MDNFKRFWRSHGSKVYFFLFLLIVGFLGYYSDWNPHKAWHNVKCIFTFSWLFPKEKSAKKDTTYVAPINSIPITDQGKAWITKAKEWKQKFFNEVKSHNQDNTDWQRKLDSLKSVGCKTSIAKVTHHKKKKHHAPVYQTHHYVGGGSSGYFEHPHRHKSKRPCN